MKILKVLSLLGLTFALSANAQISVEENKEVSKEDSWMARSGDFGAALLVTDDHEGFFEAWNEPASDGYAPRISAVSQANRGDVVVALVLFTGCEADGQGNCNSEIDFKVVNPDGTVYANMEGAELWKLKPAPVNGVMQLGVTYLGFEIEPDDQLGEYRIEAVVMDLNGKNKLNLLQKLSVVEDEIEEVK